MSLRMAMDNPELHMGVFETLLPVAVQFVNTLLLEGNSNIERVE